MEETIHTWETLSPKQREGIVAAHVIGLKKNGVRCNAEKLMRLFELGRPKIVAGPEFRYCRIHSESKGVMTIILSEYL